MGEIKSFQLREDMGYNFFMPVSLLPAGKDGRNALVGAHYGENKRLNVTYRTDREAVGKLLPPGFTPTDPCTISVTFCECRDIDYMAGGGYNLVCVDASVVFQGKRDHAEGSFNLVIWMDKFYPILVGRELLGAAKLMAEVPDAKTLVGSGKSRFYAAEDGSRLVEGEVWDLAEMTDGEIKAWRRAGEGKGWLCYKHFPSVDLEGHDCSYATFCPTTNVIKRAWKAKGSVAFHQVEWEKAPLSGPVASTLSALPVLEVVSAMKWIESAIYEPNRKLL
jgi:acetoacetate decarboxylase